MDKARSVAHNASESARSFGRTAFQTSNLLPAALIGVGVYWLRRNWSEGENGYERDTYDEPGEYRYLGAESTYGSSSHGAGSTYGTGSTYGAGSAYGYETSGTRVASQGYYGGPEEQSGRTEGMGFEEERDRIGQVREGAENLKERASEFASETGERVRQTADQVREKAGRYVERTGSQLRRFKSDARRRSEQLWDRGGRLLSEYPLETTGVFFAIGVLAGLLMPSTRREDELLGELRDDVVDRAKETGRDTVEKLQHVGEETMESAKGAMEREGLAGRGTIDKAKHAASKTYDQAKSAASNAADQARSSAGKAGEQVRSKAQAWDPTRSNTAPSQEKSTSQDKSGKVHDIKAEHDVKIKKE
jgi:ElaB/YqjD/DUF883 family membrane-anchored ribosome-binding protein